MSVQTEVDVPVLSDPDENAERTEEAENADDVSEVAGNTSIADTISAASETSSVIVTDAVTTLPTETQVNLSSTSPRLTPAERDGEILPEFAELTPFNMATGGLQLDDSDPFAEDVVAIPRTFPQPSPVTNRHIHEIINRQNASRESSGPRPETQGFGGARPRTTHGMPA